MPGSHNLESHAFIPRNITLKIVGHEEDCEPKRRVGSVLVQKAQIAGLVVNYRSFDLARFPRCPIKPKRIDEGVLHERTAWRALRESPHHYLHSPSRGASSSVCHFQMVVVHPTAVIAVGDISAGV